MSAYGVDVVYLLPSLDSLLSSQFVWCALINGALAVAALSPCHDITELTEDLSGI